MPPPPPVANAMHNSFSIQQQSSSSSSNRFIEHDVSTRKLRRPEFPGRNVVFNKMIAGKRRTLLLNVKPARMSVKIFFNYLLYNFFLFHAYLMNFKSTFKAVKVCPSSKETHNNIVLFWLHQRKLCPTVFFQLAALPSSSEPMIINFSKFSSNTLYGPDNHGHLYTQTSSRLPVCNDM